MKKTLIMFALMSLSIFFVSCSDTSLNTEKIEKKVIRSRKNNVLEIKQKVKFQVEKDVLLNVESTQYIDLKIEREEPFLFNSPNDSDAFFQEQDTGFPMDPDNEDDFYFILSDENEINVEQDTGVYLDPDSY